MILIFFGLNYRLKIGSTGRFERIWFRETPFSRSEFYSERPAKPPPDGAKAGGSLIDASENYLHEIKIFIFHPSPPPPPYGRHIFITVAAASSSFFLASWFTSWLRNQLNTCRRVSPAVPAQPSDYGDLCCLKIQLPHRIKHIFPHINPHQTQKRLN